MNRLKNIHQGIKKADLYGIIANKIVRIAHVIFAVESKISKILRQTTYSLEKTENGICETAFACRLSRHSVSVSKTTISSWLKLDEIMKT